MLFNSPEYLFFFLPISLVVYFSLSRLTYNKTSRLWLVTASLFFYGWWNPAYLILIGVSIVVNFQLGKYILQSKAQKVAKYFLFFGVMFNIILLVFFKYADFLIMNFNWFTGGELEALNVILPLAISFFSFQQIAYLADCYGDHEKNYTFLEYSLFVTFFPQLIAGPIVHHKEMMPQFSLSKNRKYISENFTRGVFIFCLGLFKKIVIADSFAVWANAGFDGDTILTLFEAWAASLSYTFQLYYDFSGYTDMAIGSALMFNIRLPLNFNSPYKATNIQDFWRRWHMTLSRWLRDYVYIPLGGNRNGKPNTIFNLFITFLIGGIWHGAAWTFVIWGALHGGALIIHRLWSTLGIKVYSLLAWLLTFVFVNFSWVVFRADTPEGALRVIKGMIGLNGVRVSQDFMGLTTIFLGTPLEVIEKLSLGLQTDLVTIQFICLFGFIAFYTKNSMELSGYIYSNNEALSTRYGTISAFLICVVILLSFGDSQPSEFLYFNF